MKVDHKYNDIRYTRLCNDTMMKYCREKKTTKSKAIEFSFVSLLKKWIVRVVTRLTVNNARDVE